MQIASLVLSVLQARSHNSDSSIKVQKDCEVEDT